ncbi:glycosyltransferase family 4 protein [Nocardia crassostreae]|uniref:glycosyltransferase family 4 protein n=1 Tax=Nocardia crassostreae TaxID=53428 RepID=UPI0009FE6D71|nr:glycosyltransferase family 4 protein [Nocardia crassostreae]
MKVLLTHPSAELYGADRMALLALDALVRSGHTVTAVVPVDGSLVDRMRESGATVIVADVGVLRKSDLRPQGFLRLLRTVLAGLVLIARLLRSIDPDVVYVNTIVQPWWIVAARLHRRRVVVHVREAEPQLPRAVRTVINAPLLAAHVIACNSASTRDEIASVVAPVRDRLLVVYNGKDWSDYHVDREDSGRNSLRLTVIGRLSPRKGQDVAVRALAELAADGTDATLTLVGAVFDGYEWFERELRDLAKELGVADRVEFAGFHADIRPVLGRTDIAVVPSRIEPFGTVAAESLAAGVLTVVSEVQGLTEILLDGRTGLTFPSNDHRALARCCSWAATHPEESRRLAMTGQRDVLERFSLARYEKQILDILESAAAGRAVR